MVTGFVRVRSEKLDYFSLILYLSLLFLSISFFFWLMNEKSSAIPNEERTLSDPLRYWKAGLRRAAQSPATQACAAQQFWFG